MSQVYKFDRDNARRKATVVPLKEAIDQMLRSYKLQTRFNETYLEAFWEQMMGKSIASRTNRLYVRNATLYIEIASAPLRGELATAKQKLIKLINQDMGSDVVEDVVFI